MPESDEHANSLSEQGKEGESNLRILELISELDTQRVTIRTLKALLEQQRMELDALHSNKAFPVPCSHSRVCDEDTTSIRKGADRRIQVLESNNERLAAEVCVFKEFYDM